MFFFSQNVPIGFFFYFIFTCHVSLSFFLSLFSLHFSTHFSVLIFFPRIEASMKLIGLEPFLFKRWSTCHVLIFHWGDKRVVPKCLKQVKLLFCSGYLTAPFFCWLINFGIKGNVCQFFVWLICFPKKCWVFEFGGNLQL